MCSSKLLLASSGKFSTHVYTYNNVFQCLFQSVQRVGTVSSRTRSSEVKENGVSNNKPDADQVSPDDSPPAKDSVRLPYLCRQDYGRRLEKISRFLFPVSFIIFNIGYWTSYIIMSLRSWNRHGASYFSIYGKSPCTKIQLTSQITMTKN